MAQTKTLIVDTKKYEDGSISQLAAYDVLQLKVAVFSAVAIFLAKTMWEWWNKKEDKQEAQVEMLVKAFHEDRQRWEHLERVLTEIKEEMVPKHEIDDMIEKKIIFTHKLKGHQQ